MDTASQQRILGYFIEEAKEHLQTLEQGILQLGTAVQDPETVNEMFRAAHSVKGGAAMLGYASIQKTAHRLEDSFKILKENPVNVDQKLESLFLTGYDHLQDLIERLESSVEFKDEDAIEILQQAESNFAILQQYLQQLLGGGVSGNIPAPVNISERVKETLKQMLQLFKQADTPENRQKLQHYCANLGELAPTEPNWQQFVSIARTAISNKKYPYNTIAQIVIREIKQAGDNLHVGNTNAIIPSKNLQQLAATAQAPTAKATETKISIPKEPKGAATALLQAFNKAELTQIIKLISSQM
ncbi:MAG: Hpt domain-containing protein [Xenococcaceae cyanobacterium MO_207.B15]|nr:Hpt domain-containing protein [Xenococcaceae cyanobacterium MO_207.B15]MDJ0742341.1 Hpt domain-containing protein [Xenococcaceae cyanobacterium MO_167.B27]